jgi:hypothetical protein
MSRKGIDCKNNQHFTVLIVDAIATHRQLSGWASTVLNGNDRL